MSGILLVYESNSLYVSDKIYSASYRKANYYGAWFRVQVFGRRTFPFHCPTVSAGFIFLFMANLCAFFGWKVKLLKNTQKWFLHVQKRIILEPITLTRWLWMSLYVSFDSYHSIPQTVTCTPLVGLLTAHSYKPEWF